MLAKSDGLSLETHIKDLMDVSETFKIALPTIKDFFKDDKFWDYLKISILFHDLGKSTKGFQDLMKEHKRYRFRHEVLSAILAQNYTNNELIINAVLAHHKNFNKLKELFNEYDNNEKYNQDRWIAKEFEDLDFKWIEIFLVKYNIELKELKLNDLNKIVKKWTSKRAKRKISELEKFQNIFLSASLSICDHNASAGIKKIQIITQDKFEFLHNTKYEPYCHQKSSWQTKGNALLIAPTGQGKTESSLGWLQTQLNLRQGRTFYILPFTASINAMTKRISSKDKGFGNEALVGLLHGKAKFFIDEYYEKKDGQSLKDLIDINKKIIKPFKVVTPFQILKWAFGVKGFEKGFTELVGSYLIFDEIHIYDKELYSRILFFIEWLIDKLKVKVFIMTATMPSFMQTQIKNILKIEKIIKPDAELIYNIKRHKIKLMDSTIEDQKGFIQSKVNSGKNVLVVCNTVSKAQDMYRDIDCVSKTLLHSGFNGKDRTEIEKQIQSREDCPQLLVGTQAIEVSLDIDYDLIITEPAPIDALLQRFGRVYREKNRVLKVSEDANCFVTTKIEDVNKLIYDEDLLLNTLNEIKKIQDIVIKEDNVQALLDKIYKPFELDDNLRKIFRKYLDDLYPFNVYEDSEDDFFSQFDGIEVLPIELWNDFKNYVERKQFLEAEKLFISISKRRFAMMISKNRIIKNKIEEYKSQIYILNAVYSSKEGIAFDELVDKFI